jgi:membrane protease YdiL (CAAX protease family)
MPSKSWNVGTAVRDLLEIVLVLGFIVIVPALVERGMVSAGLATSGINRILATAGMFIAWALLAVGLTKLNREPLAEIGLRLPANVWRSVLAGFVLAGLIFATVVTLETFGVGGNRLGDMGTELRRDHNVLILRILVSIAVVGVVEELIFRGFLMTRLAKLLGGRGAGWMAALIIQAALFGFAHAYQHTYGIVLTAALGLLFGSVYLLFGRSLLPIVVAHGVYDAAHAYYIGSIQ